MRPLATPVWLLNHSQMNSLVELTRNSLYAVVFHLAPRFANVLLYITIGRLSGPEEAGVFALAMTYLLIFTTITRGLDDLVVRQVSWSSDEAARYLTNFLLLRLVLSLVLFGISVFLVLFVFTYTDRTIGVILIMVLSVVPDSLSYVPQAILMGQHRFGVLAAVLSSANLFKLLGGWAILLVDGTLQAVAWVWFIGTVCGTLVLTGIAIRHVGGLRRSDWLDWRALMVNQRAALSFLLITAMMTLEAQIDTLILSALHDTVVVGWYSAATTVTFSLVMFAQAYRFAVYPLMARYAQDGSENLSRLYKRSVRYLGTIVLPMVFGVFLLSPNIIVTVFGPEFERSALALRVLIPVLVFIFLNIPDSRMMLVQERQEQILLFLVSSLMVNGILNWIMDPVWGAAGAAAARLCSSSLFFFLTHRYVVRNFVPLHLGRLLFRPIAAALVMSVVVWLLRERSLLLSISSGAVTYIAALWFFGGIPPEDLLFVRRSLVER